eukprot:COSAG01_NODE_1452_length_10260_cov_26.827970_9_plen_59_part_00
MRILGLTAGPATTVFVVVLLLGALMGAWAGDHRYPAPPPDRFVIGALGRKALDGAGAS